MNAIQVLNKDNKILAYHDRSDGGLFVTLCEMAFAGHCGISVNLPAARDNVLASLFAEEAGAVIQVANADIAAVEKVMSQQGLAIMQLRRQGFAHVSNWCKRRYD